MRLFFKDNIAEGGTRIKKNISEVNKTILIAIDDPIVFYKNHIQFDMSGALITTINVRGLKYYLQIHLNLGKRMLQH